MKDIHCKESYASLRIRNDNELEEVLSRIVPKLYKDLYQGHEIKIIKERRLASTIFQRVNLPITSCPSNQPYMDLVGYAFVGTNSYILMGF